MEFKFEIKGLRELEAGLAEIPAAVRGKTLEAALMRAAKPILDEARSRAPVRQGGAKRMGKGSKVRMPGFLRASLRRARKRGSDASATVQIGPHRRAFYGMFQELGTSRQAARPFLRPAFESKAQDALQLLRTSLASEILKTAQRIASRSFGRSGLGSRGGLLSRALK